MDLTNFENQMVFSPFITDNQLFCEFNFSRKNGNTFQKDNLGATCVGIKLPEAPRAQFYVFSPEKILKSEWQRGPILFALS